MQIERRRVRDGGGPTLRVLAPESTGAAREWLRFDAFERQPHWHFAPEGEDEIRPLDERVDPIAEAFDRLTQEASSLLERAGAPEALVRAAASPDASEAAVLRDAQRAMRHRPAERRGSRGHPVGHSLEER